MYKIDYLDQSIALTSIDASIDFITDLVKNPISSSPYFLSVILPNKNVIYFGIGATPTHILVLFKPYSSLEDYKLSCDPSQSYEQSPVIKFLYPHTTLAFECNTFNLLSFDFVLSQLSTLLIAGDMSCLPCYSH